AHKLVAEAVALLEPFGDKALRLRQLAEFAVARKY
ncbi:TPA: geranyl transferase, partial [Neisseria gonorrhoeae]